MASVALISLCLGPAMAADTIRIGYIDPLSGSFGNVGDAGQKHFQYILPLPLHNI